MGLTLIQVKTRLESLANSHRQLNTVKFVGYDEALDGADLVYPACVIELQKDNKVSLTDRYTYFRFKIYFFDLIDVASNSLNNEYEVKSDLASIAQDYLAMLNFTDYQFDWGISSDYNLSIANYQLQDLCAGVYVEVQIGVLFDANRCQVPADGVTFETDNSMKIITNYIHDVTAEDTELTLTAMTNREILMFFLGDKLLKPTTAAPTPDDYRYTYATGRFEFGTTIQPEQVIQILNRSL